MNNSIGVYDSGMGGLIVLETLIKEFPHENFIFIADNKNFPYGTKTSKQIEQYNIALSNYLISQNVKAICIACNTASANSTKLDDLVNIPIVKTIGPTVKKVAQSINNKQNNILVIATLLTTKNRVYENELNKYFKNLPHSYYFEATQNFVNLVEEGRFGTKESFNEVKDTLEKYLNKDIDKIILGCTHFSKLIPELKELFHNVEIYDSGLAIAEELNMKLENNLNKEHEGSITLITTGDLDLFIKQTSWFKYKDRVIYKHIDLDFE